MFLPVLYDMLALAHSCIFVQGLECKLLEGRFDIFLLVRSCIVLLVHFYIPLAAHPCMTVLVLFCKSPQAHLDTPLLGRLYIVELVRHSTAR